MSAGLLEARVIPVLPEYKKDQIVIPELKIIRRMKEMARPLATIYKDKNLLMVGLLTGCYMVMSDLGKALWEEGLHDMEQDFMVVGSYGDRTESSGHLDIKSDMKTNPKERHILIVDDVADTRLTLAGIHQLMLDRGAMSVASFVLVNKQVAKPLVQYEPTYSAFITPRIWLEGKGMDSAGKGRANPNVIVGMDYPNGVK